MDFDFGYGQNDNGGNTNPDNGSNNENNVTNLENGKIEHQHVSGDDVDGLDDTGNDVVKRKNEETDNKGTVNAESLQEGTSIEVGNSIYTVDNAGNLIDKDGNIFKEASQVNEWLKSFDEVNEVSKDITINSIQEALGVELTGEDGNVIEFDNSVDGIKNYVEAVIENSKIEHYETAINTLYQKYPILNDVLNYYIANGNSLDGFGELPDRSNIVIDESNEAQQEAIIKVAWEEQGRKGDVNSYINYLKSTGILLATAQDELAGLQESDRAYREQLAEQARQHEEERQEQLLDYWNGVYDVIKKRSIAGYQIPESIIVNRNGQKISVTPDDFFNYIYRVDKDGLSAYHRDLVNETPESRRDDELLRAYLKFVGGDYSNLVDMAINKQKVNTLKLKAKEKNTNSVRIVKPKSATAKGADIDFGYN